MLLMRYMILWTLVLVGQSLLAQTERKTYAYTIGASVSKGFIIKQNESVAHLAVSHPQVMSVYVNKHTFGKKYCEQLYYYPDTGFSLSYFNYFNPVLGKSVALSTYIAIPVTRLNHSEVSFKIGTGLAYHTRPHHPTYNNSNTAIGTPLSFSLLGSLRYVRQISDVWESGLSLSLTHFSNGAFSKPNAGINVPTIDVEVSRKIKPTSSEKVNWANQSKKFEGIYYFLGVSSGLKELDYGEDKFSFLNMHFQASRRFNAISAIHLGLDAFFDNALKAFIEKEVKDTKPDYRRAGLVAGHEFFYDRLSLVTQLGIYIYRPFKGFSSSVYQRYGLRYTWTDHLITYANLKTHGGRADFVEWGLGVKF